MSLSIQEQKLKAIADAIREKDGSTDPIVANNFPDRIRAIQSGGGGVEGGYELLERGNLDIFSSNLTLLNYSALILSDSYEVLEGWT